MHQRLLLLPVSPMQGKRRCNGTFHSRLLRTRSPSWDSCVCATDTFERPSNDDRIFPIEAMDQLAMTIGSLAFKYALHYIWICNAFHFRLMLIVFICKPFPLCMAPIHSRNPRILQLPSSLPTHRRHERPNQDDRRHARSFFAADPSRTPTIPRPQRPSRFQSSSVRSLYERGEYAPDQV